MNFFVSVVIPTYNRKNELLAALESVFVQTIKPLEIIVVDDNSTDGTAEEFATWSLPHQVVYEKLTINSGPAAARNAGIARAKGSHIAFLDSDDIWESQRIEKQIDRLSKCADSSQIVVYTKGWIKRPYEVILRPLRAISTGEAVADYLFANGGFFGQSSILVPTELARSIMYNPKLRIHEDWDWYIRLEAQGARFLMVEEPLVIYFDDSNDGRASAPQPQRSFDLLEPWKPSISTRAYYALKARFAPQLRTSKPLKGVWFILLAMLRGAINAPYAVALLGTLIHPQLRNTAYKIRGRLIRKQMPHKRSGF